MTDTIRVEGLAAFQKELRAVDKEWPKELRKANLAVADLVTKAAKSKAVSLGGVAAKAAPSLKAQAQQRSASVKIGSARYPYALGAEFGGGKYGKGNPTPRGGYTTQFKPYLRLGRGGAGYFLHPTIREKTDQVVEEYGKAIDHLMNKAFPG